MAAKAGELSCELYAGAFSGEVVFAVKTTEGCVYEGVVPKHYANPSGPLSSVPTTGTVRVRIIRNGGDEALIATPDGASLAVPAGVVVYR